MTDREKLELAAKACGIEYSSFEGNTPVVQEWCGHKRLWNPLIDQADSDRMACKLRIEIKYGEGVNLIPSVVWVQHPYVRIEHNNTDEDVCRAVREARLLVAVEIGRAMP